MHAFHETLLTSSMRYARGFFPTRLSVQMKELFACTWIQGFALSAVSLFEPIYLYSLGYPIYQIMLFYLGVYVLYFCLIPLGGKLAKSKGFAHGIVVGSFFLVLYYLFLFQIPQSGGFVFLAIIALALQKTFFWPGFHGDFALFGQGEQRGRELGIMTIVGALTVVLGPLFGGLVIALFNYQMLFIVVVGLILLSNIPLFLSEEYFIPSSMCYKDCLRELFSKEYRSHLFGYMGYGEEFIWQFAWPLFAYLVLTNVAEIGTIVAGTIVISSIALLYIARLIDRVDRKKVMKVGVWLYSLSWVFRIFGNITISFALGDLFARSVRHPVQLPITAGVYKRALATQHVVRTGVLFEMALAIGKIAAAIILAILFYFLPNRWDLVFILGALFSLMYLFLTRHIQHA